MENPYDKNLSRTVDIIFNLLLSVLEVFYILQCLKSDF